MPMTSWCDGQYQSHIVHYSVDDIGLGPMYTVKQVAHAAILATISHNNLRSA